MKFEVKLSSYRFEKEPEKIEINSLADLERLQKENDGIELIIDFDDGFIEINDGLFSRRWGEE